MVRFPHLPEQIFQKLNNKSLFKCREVARSWQNIIDGRNHPWLRIVNIPAILKRRNTYLHLSAKTGQIEAFKTGLNKEGDKSIQNERGETPFHYACQSGRLKMVEFLLQNNDLEIDINSKDNHAIDLNAKTNCGNTALCYACFKGHADIVKILMKNASHLSIDDDWTGFHWACEKGHSDVVKILMENAATLSINFNYRKKDGMTAFHIACDRGFSDVVKIIMEYAATLSIDLNIRDKNGYTAFYLACKKDKSDVVKIITKNAADLSNWSISL